MASQRGPSMAHYKGRHFSTPTGASQGMAHGSHATCGRWHREGGKQGGSGLGRMESKKSFVRLLKKSDTMAFCFQLRQVLDAGPDETPSCQNEPRPICNVREAATFPPQPRRKDINRFWPARAELEQLGGKHRVAGGLPGGGVAEVTGPEGALGRTRSMHLPGSRRRHQSFKVTLSVPKTPALGVGELLHLVRSCPQRCHKSRLPGIQSVFP